VESHFALVGDVQHEPPRSPPSWAVTTSTATATAAELVTLCGSSSSAGTRSRR
jgi:hypothetical protein